MYVPTYAGCVRGLSFALALSLLLPVASGCGGSSKPATRSASGPFTYDSSQPLRFADRGRVNSRYPIAIDDVSYTAGTDRINAFLVLPPGGGKRRPAVVFVHGSGGDRQQLLVPATWLAARHAVGLVITEPSSTAAAPSGGSAVDELKRQARLEERDVVAVRRGIDLLRSRPDVDPRRLGYVGWSAGARTGAILAGVEPRLRTVVLMSGGATPISTYAAKAPKPLRPAVRRYLAPVDPLRYVPRASATGLLLQDGRKDQIVPRSALEAMAHAAPHGTTVRWYAADHGLNPKAYHDQLVWLAQKLGLTGTPVKNALTGP
jgi:dienelactone hydrolase